MAFDQYARTVRVDLTYATLFGAGMGLGVQRLINLDSITGDLLAHYQQICVDFNHCLLDREEYRSEMRYLRHAQMKIRLTAYLARPDAPPGVNAYPETAHPEEPIPPDLGESPGNELREAGTPLDPSKAAVLRELDGLNAALNGVKSSGVRPGTVSGNISVPEMTAVHLDYSIVARTRKENPGETGERFEQVPLLPGGRLRSGDQFKIEFSADRDGYVYILNFDSSGQALVLFPHAGIALGNEVKAGARYQLPPREHDWYYLDNVPGRESLYLISTPFPIQNLDRLIDELQAGEAQPRRVRTARLRGALEGLTDRESAAPAGPGQRDGALPDPEAAGDGLPRAAETVRDSRKVMTAVKIDFEHT
jgi:hypothetical protein